MNMGKRASLNQLLDNPHIINKILVIGVIIIIAIFMKKHDKALHYII